MIIASMARTRSARVVAVREQLAERLRSGVDRPGARFVSARALAAQYGVSYQTADRLLAELAKAGLLERRAAAGTFVPGAESVLCQAWLCFSPRAARPQSFGARLLDGLCAGLRAARLPFTVAADGVVMPADAFPVLWEMPAARIGERPGMLLNARPPAGLIGARLDSVAIDDFFGGACAAELLPAGTALAVLTGPDGDSRSDERRAGFLSRCPHARVICAGGWGTDDGLRVAMTAIEAGNDGIFACNDRLAAAVQLQCQRARRPTPPLVGFDDAPVAEALGLTTIAIPWDAWIHDAVEGIGRRLSGDRSAARQRLVTPRPVVRSSCAIRRSHS
jgi:hypothetical protein